MADLDRWIEIAKDCKYLPENDLKVDIYTSIDTSRVVVECFSCSNICCSPRNSASMCANYSWKNLTYSQCHLL